MSTRKTTMTAIIPIIEIASCNDLLDVPLTIPLTTTPSAMITPSRTTTMIHIMMVRDLVEGPALNTLAVVGVVVVLIVGLYWYMSHLQRNSYIIKYHTY